MVTGEKLLTAEEFFALPEPVEGGKMELVDGKVVVMSPVGLRHGDLAVTLAAELRRFVRAHSLGTTSVETGFRLRRDPDAVRAPDVSFLRRERVPPRPADLKFIEGPPDLAIEITSPDDRDSEIAKKVGEYLAAGVMRVWVVRPELETVTIHRADGSARTLGIGETLTSDDAGFPVPGFALAVAVLFAEE
jgi:Uma2 family endonuclease